jgi:hypothetical protein
MLSGIKPDANPEVTDIPLTLMVALVWLTVEVTVVESVAFVTVAV